MDGRSGNTLSQTGRDSRRLKSFLNKAEESGRSSLAPSSILYLDNAWSGAERVFVSSHVGPDHGVTLERDSEPRLAI
jgi:hypothetical protein